MKHILALCSLILLGLLSACSKHPSSLVGVWKNGEQGIFSTQTVLTLQEDGSGIFHGSLGIFGGGSSRFTWEYSKPTLTFAESGGRSTRFNVISLSATDLVLQESDGTLLSFRRISDTPPPAAAIAMQTAEPTNSSASAATNKASANSGATAAASAARVAPSPTAPETDTQAEQVFANLRKLSAAADQFYLEKGVGRAAYSDLVGPGKYLPELKPVLGEDYTKVRLSQQGEVRVAAPNGKTYCYSDGGGARVIDTPVIRQWSRDEVLAALRRGAVGTLPASVEIVAVRFEVENETSAQTVIAGEAELRFRADTYTGVERVGIKRQTGDLFVHLVKRAKAEGDQATVPFRGTLFANAASPSLPLDDLKVSDWGKTLAELKPAIVIGSAEHARLTELETAASAAAEKVKPIQKKWEALQQIGNLLTDYNAFVAASTFKIKGYLNDGLQSRALVDAYTRDISHEKEFRNRQVQHAAFIKLVQPAFEPEFARLKALQDARTAAMRAYAEFLEQR